MNIVVDVDLRPLLGAARDQRQRPTCLAFAASAAHEANRGEVEYLSAEYLFFHGARRSHCDPLRGLTPAAIVDALDQDGQPIELAWPYIPVHPDITAWSPPTISEPCHRALATFSRRSVMEVQDVLRSGKPAILVTAVTLAMYSPNGEAVIRVRPNDVTTARTHAVLAVGFGHANDGSYILVRNSWGIRWGAQGHGWLHDAYLEPLLVTTGVVS